MATKKAKSKSGSVNRAISMLARFPLQLSATFRMYFCLLLGIKKNKKSKCIKKEKIIIEE